MFFEYVLSAKLYVLVNRRAGSTDTCETVLDVVEQTLWH